MASCMDVIDEFREIVIGAPNRIDGKVVGILLVEAAFQIFGIVNDVVRREEVQRLILSGIR